MQNQWFKWLTGVLAVLLAVLGFEWHLLKTRQKELARVDLRADVKEMTAMMRTKDYHNLGRDYIIEAFLLEPVYEKEGYLWAEVRFNSLSSKADAKAILTVAGKERLTYAKVSKSADGNRQYLYKDWSKQELMDLKKGAKIVLIVRDFENNQLEEYDGIQVSLRRLQKPSQG